jgi:hypothetical protein
MFLLVIAVIIEFVLIYLLSRQIFSLLYLLIYLPTKHHNISQYIATLLFLPGTVIHEFSHAIIAALLRVKIGRINPYPHRDEETGEFKAGSIELEHVDWIRLSIIGIAPPLIGIAILTLSILYIFNYRLPLDNLLLTLPELLQTINYPLFILIFIISVTMFSSKRDLKEFMLVTPVFVLIGVLLYYAGFRISIDSPVLNYQQMVLNNLAFVLGFVLLVDLLVFIFLFVPISLVLSLLGKKITRI